MGYKVVALSSSSKKESFVKELGANVYVDGSKEDPATALQKLGGAAMIVVTTPDMEGVKSLVGGLDKGGTMLILGGGFLRSQPHPTPPLSRKTKNSCSWRRYLHPLRSTRHTQSFRPWMAVGACAGLRGGDCVCAAEGGGVSGADVAVGQGAGSV